MFDGPKVGWRKEFQVRLMGGGKKTCCSAAVRPSTASDLSRAWLRQARQRGRNLAGSSGGSFAHCSNRSVGRLSVCPSARPSACLGGRAGEK